MLERMAYLLGMVAGNGSIFENRGIITVIIDIPHKKINGNGRDSIYRAASELRDNISELIGTDIKIRQEDNRTFLFFEKPDGDYVINLIKKYIGNAASHQFMELDREIFKFNKDEIRAFLQGFADVTGYIRRSNRFFKKYEHRVYLEVPQNWKMVVDICNLLQIIDVPVQNIDWAHPCIRVSSYSYSNNSNSKKTLKSKNWKKEHQIKIWANEFTKVGFHLNEKQKALLLLSKEFENEYLKNNQNKNIEEYTHRYYWDCSRKYGNKIKEVCEDDLNDVFIPIEIRGKKYIKWSEIAEALGYVKL